MVSSFRGLNELQLMKRGTGLITDWKQTTGHLLVGGDSRVIRVWDAHTEIQVMVNHVLPSLQSLCANDKVHQDIETNSDSPVTALASEDNATKVALASFADGSVKVLDWRLQDEDSIVRSYSAHSAWVQNVKLHPTLSGQFLTARSGLDIFPSIRHTDAPLFVALMET